VAPKSLPHKITVPGLSALFGGRETPAPAPVPAAPEPAAPVAAAPATPPVPAADPVALAPMRAAATRKRSKGVRVTQPEIDGKPKGRHTLVIDEAVLEELSLLAWAENMSVSAIAREAFDAYLGTRRRAILQARELRESFGRKREAV
jgi:hypothetical protein